VFGLLSDVFYGDPPGDAEDYNHEVAEDPVVPMINF
jgi:hypothetical protein